MQAGLTAADQTVTRAYQRLPELRITPGVKNALSQAFAIVLNLQLCQPAASNMNGARPLVRGATGQVFGRRPDSAAARRQPKRGQQHASRAAAAAGGTSPPPLPPPGSGGGIAGGSASSRFGWAKWALLPTAAAALLGGVSNALASSQQAELEAGQARAERSLKAAEHWITEIEGTPGIVKAFDAAMLMEADHGILEVG
jgi:hypothetical protein